MREMPLPIPTQVTRQERESFVVREEHACQVTAIYPSAPSRTLIDMHYTKRSHTQYVPDLPAGFLLLVRSALCYQPYAPDFVMFDIILYQPEIPPNTGNIIRLCANTGARLHLVKPLGFELDDRQMRRAGLDYHEFATITVYQDWAECAARFETRRMFAVSTRGTQRYDRMTYAEGDAFVFGPETRGLPADLLKLFPEERRIRLPMLPQSRSLNLSNTVAVVIYEAWRQVGFGMSG